MVRPIHGNAYYILIKLSLKLLYKNLQTMFFNTVLIKKMKIRIITVQQTRNNRIQIQVCDTRVTYIQVAVIVVTLNLASAFRQMMTSIWFCACWCIFIILIILVIILWCYCSRLYTFKTVLFYYHYLNIVSVFQWVVKSIPTLAYTFSFRCGPVFSKSICWSIYVKRFTCLGHWWILSAVGSFVTACYGMS